VNIKFVKCRAGYSLLDHRKNGDILGLKADSAEKKLVQYKQKMVKSC